jgi:hypothetical protein
MPSVQSDPIVQSGDSVQGAAAPKVMSSNATVPGFDAAVAGWSPTFQTFFCMPFADKSAICW